MTRACIVFFFITLALPVRAQFTELTKLTVPNAIAYATVDRPGELYLVDSRGTLQKLDTDGNPQSSYTPVQPVLPTVLDARDGARIFTYYRDRQEYIYFSPSLADDVGWQKVDPAFAIAPHLVCPFGDYGLIILDSADWSLKKVNLKTSVVNVDESIASRLTKNSRIISMREYQNFIFLLDAAQGIIIFNGIGKWIRTIPVKHLTWFNFVGEELYYRQGQNLVLIDLFTTASRQLPLPTAAGYALLTDERLYAVDKDAVTIYRYRP
jgi:hypothetical protein